jgi:hypothetical protein
MKKLLTAIFCFLLLAFVSSSESLVFVRGKTSAGGAASGYYGEGDDTDPTSDNIDEDFRCSKITVSASGAPVGMRAYIDDFSGTERVELFVYDDNGASGDAGDLLGRTGEGCGLCDGAKQWLEITSWDVNPGTLPAGDYWVCAGCNAVVGGQLHYNAGSLYYDARADYTFNSPPDPSDFNPNNGQRNYLIQLKY